MCGIAGFVALSLPPDEAQARIQAMTARLHHRGPDASGVVVHPDAALGMTRLAIVDVAHGRQPMANEDGSVVIVYNGEVYNAPELRARLQRAGIRFTTRSDTEVILRLYEADPDHVEEQLAGMWAFAVHDRRRRRVVLSRDRFGIKPLFIADTGGALAFGSELRCFDRAAPPFARLFTIDHDAAHAMMSWSYIPETSTIYSGVKRLPPATRLTIDLETGGRRPRTYWRLAPSADAAAVSSLDAACELVEPLLRRAVREHLESDVPIATFLSGGIDSSLVTAYAGEQSLSPITAYTIGFTDPAFDESRYARPTATRAGVALCVELLDEERARERIADALLAFDEPFGDSSSLATYLLAEHVARDFKVAIGGDGGDEVFAGYRKYVVAQRRRPFARAPRLRDACGRLLQRIGRLGPASPGRWQRLLRQVAIAGASLDGADAAVYAATTRWAPVARTAPLLRVPMSCDRFALEAEARFRAASGSPLQQTLAADLGSMLCNDMLVKVDRTSMRCGLEARVPFLDHRVVEAGVGLPEAFTLGSPWEPFCGKRVLRALHARRFGGELARRRKQGFGIPIQPWLRGPFDGACERLFEARRLDRFGILASAELSEGRFRRWVNGPDPWIAWYAFALAAWCEATLGDGPDALRQLFHDTLTGPARVGRTAVAMVGTV